MWRPQHCLTQVVTGTYVCDRLVRSVDPVWMGTESVVYAPFGGTESSAEHRDVYHSQSTTKGVY